MAQFKFKHANRLQIVNLANCKLQITGLEGQVSEIEMVCYKREFPLAISSRCTDCGIPQCIAVLSIQPLVGKVGKHHKMAGVVELILTIT